MELFDILPGDFFKVLVGKNKEIYAKSLNILSHFLAQDQLKIKKEDFVKSLKDAEIDWASNFEFEADDIPNETPVTASKISYIVNRLEDCGWIEFILDASNNEEYIVIPDYAIFILNAMKKITSEVDAFSDSLVHSTYSELKLEDESPDEFFYSSLQRAYQNTMKLKDDLVMLGHGIQISANKLGSLFSTNDILKDHFDRFKERIANRYYHPYKTFDSVTRFKRPIVNILNKWLNDRELRKQLAAQSVMFKREKNLKGAEEEVVKMIIEITDMYDQFSIMFEKIDDEYIAYTKSSVTKIIYLNNSDKTIKGHLETIFKHYAKSYTKMDIPALGKLVGDMSDSTNFYDQGFLDEKSVVLPLIRGNYWGDEPLAVLDFDDFDDSLMFGFAEGARESLTDTRVYEFMEKVFNGQDSIMTSDIPLDELRNFLIFIIAVARSIDDNCFYIIANIDCHDYIKLHGYLVPDFKFTRKVKGEE